MISITRLYDHFYGGTGPRRAGRASGLLTVIITNDDVRHTKTGGLILTLRLGAPYHTLYHAIRNGCLLDYTQALIRILPIIFLMNNAL